MFEMKISLNVTDLYLLRKEFHFNAGIFQSFRYEYSLYICVETRNLNTFYREKCFSKATESLILYFLRSALILAFLLSLISSGIKRKTFFVLFQSHSLFNKQSKI